VNFCLSRTMWTVLFMATALLGAVVPTAQAQDAQGSYFNAALFNVGGVGERTDMSLPGTQGSVGCGGAWGDALTTALNTALNESVVSEETLPLAQRRDLWRFCDAMTAFGAGWDNNTVITPEQEHLQNTGFAPAEMFGQVDIARSIASWQMGAVATRVQQVRTAARGHNAGYQYALARQLDERRDQPVQTSLRQALHSPIGLVESDSEPRELNSADIANLLREGINAGDDAMGVEGLGLFMSGRYIHLDADTTSQELGSDTDGGGFTLGADYRIGTDYVIGAAFGYNHYDTDYSSNAGDSEIDDIAGMLFGSAFLGDTLYLDGIFRGSFLMTDSSKRTPTFDGGPAFADLDSDPDGFTLSVDVGLGAEIPMDAWLFNPYARLGVFYTEIEDFSETGGDGSMNLSFDDQDVTSLPLTIGGSVVYSISTSFGVIAPYARLEYLHEFLDQAADVKGFLQVIPTAQFSVDPNSTDRDYGSAGVGASLTLQGGWSGYVDYDALVGFDDLDSHTATIGFRKDL
jgi:outer membrane autotransporter protein